ncbi:MAG TPA: DNA primase, partial [Bacteroidales bacterium]|nr:DNA primase [Bacteroidales bacterium]
MISQDTIERILEAAPIEAVIGEYVTLKRRGANYVTCCPFHNEKTPSFSVSPSKGIFKCFGCGKAGNVIRFIMEHEQLTYREALKFLGNKYNIPVDDREESPQEAESRLRRDSMMVVNAYAQEFYTRYLWEEQEGRDVGLSYLQERGLKEPVIREFQLGFAPAGKNVFTNAALADGYKQDLLTSTGLTIHYPARDNMPEALADRFQDRVIFPIHSLSGRIIGFGGRTLRTDKQLSKYINSPESEIYNKSRSLYGIYFAKQHITKLQKCYLVE